MYLIIAKPDDQSNNSAPRGYSFVHATDDPNNAAKCLKDGDKVYAVDKLTEITEVNISFFDKLKNLVGG